MRLPWAEFRALLYELGLLVARVGGGTLLLTGVVLVLTSLVRDEALLSKGLLVCSPEERAAFAEVDWRGGSEPTPEPQVSTGWCVAYLDAPKSPVRVSSLFTRRLEAAGWRVSYRMAGDSAGPVDGVLISANKANFYCEVVYYAPGSDSLDRSHAVVQVRMGKI